MAGGAGRAAPSFWRYAQATYRQDRDVEGVLQTALYQILTSRTGSQEHLESLKREFAGRWIYERPLGASGIAEEGG